MDLKQIKIGQLLESSVKENHIEIERLCSFFNCEAKNIEEMYGSDTVGTDILIKWSELLQYDFFRLYSQHLVLYAPPAANVYSQTGTQKKVEIQELQFRKNIYTKEIIEFIINRINKGEMTREEVISKYRIPKTTLYKWLNKYNEQREEYK
nr:helix-turn-helix domain-containing protein [Chryseobacterium jejuense]